MHALRKMLPEPLLAFDLAPNGIIDDPEHNSVKESIYGQAEI
jgi:hypothetical protein